jgi:demethylmenaquinone methyltransferase/2-methoxy-6-polyprenyl-1,4-benzoquinol methylase
MLDRDQGVTDEHVARLQTRAFYDRISRIYDLFADSSEHAVRDLGVRALGASPGQRILEIGCGTGHALVALADAVGQRGHVYGVDIAAGMIDVARSRVRSAGLQNVSFTIDDASSLCFRSDLFDNVFMSFTIESFESTTISRVLAEVRRVVRVGGRVGIVAMADTGETNAMIDLYEWAHRHWPQFVDCRPIDVIGVLEAAHLRVHTAHTTTIWGLPVVIAVGTKAGCIEHKSPTQ